MATQTTNVKPQAPNVKPQAPNVKPQPQWKIDQERNKLRQALQAMRENYNAWASTVYFQDRANDATKALISLEQLGISIDAIIS